MFKDCFVLVKEMIMTTEEMLLETWRTLDESRKHQVFQFMKLLQTTTSNNNDYTISPEEKARRWEEWANSHQKRGISLPDEALHRDTI
jgi:hypothetical protein